MPLGTDTLSSSCSIGSVQLQLQCLPGVTFLTESSEFEEMLEEEGGGDEAVAMGNQSAPSSDHAETHTPSLVASSSPRAHYLSEPPILAQVVHIPTPIGGFVLRDRPAPLAACSLGSMLRQAPLVQAQVRSASQNSLDEPPESTAGVFNRPADAQPSDADTSEAPLSPTGSEAQLKDECASCTTSDLHPVHLLTRHPALCIYGRTFGAGYDSPETDVEQFAREDESEQFARDVFLA